MIRIKKNVLKQEISPLFSKPDTCVNLKETKFGVGRNLLIFSNTFPAFYLKLSKKCGQGKTRAVRLHNDMANSWFGGLLGPIPRCLTCPSQALVLR